MDLKFLQSYSNKQHINSVVTVVVKRKFDVPDTGTGAIYSVNQSLKAINSGTSRCITVALSEPGR